MNNRLMRAKIFFIPKLTKFEGFSLVPSTIDYWCLQYGADFWNIVSVGLNLPINVDCIENALHSLKVLATLAIFSIALLSEN